MWNILVVVSLDLLPLPWLHHGMSCNQSHTARVTFRQANNRNRLPRSDSALYLGWISKLLRIRNNQQQAVGNRSSRGSFTNGFNRRHFLGRKYETAVNHDGGAFSNPIPGAVILCIVLETFLFGSKLSIQWQTKNHDLVSRSKTPR